MQAMEISRTGLDIEWRRLELIAQNLANANVAGPSNAAVYRSQSLITGPKAFGALLDRADQGSSGDPPRLGGVAVLGVEESSSPARLVHEPGNPLADKQGFVSYPAVDQAEQMTLMVKTARAYEANLVAMNAARTMYAKALELGSRT